LSAVLFAAVFTFQAAAQDVKTLASGQPQSQRNANYSMDIRLDEQSRMLHGREILTWRNTTSHTTDEMQFHLYYNAWRNDKSSFVAYNRGRGNLSDYGEDDWAYCNVKTVKVLGRHGYWEEDLSVPSDYIQPDDGNPDDMTVMRIKLPKPVRPGETVSLEIEWDSKVPRTFSRTGVRGDYYFLAQWFPKVGVFESDGTWNCHQFINTEFFADFGNYDALLTVPTGWVVGATGLEVEQIDNGDGTTTHHYSQEDVHDFAWTTTPHFDVYTERFEEPGLTPVDMRLLLMPDHASKKERYFESTKAALKCYQSWYGPYPYTHVTIVDPAYRSRSGGMEYPTFFTGGTSWLSPSESLSPESVTIHEFGHGYWYGIVANNEFEDAWLDEGLNTYSHMRTMKEEYPPPVMTRRYLDGFIPYVFPSIKLIDRMDGADPYFGFYSTLKRDPMSVLSYLYGPGSYGLNSYNKAAMMLRTVENYLGWETFQKVMSTFYERWKFKHPKPNDFFMVVNEVSGQDLTWFFEQAYNSSDVFDYAVGTVSSQPLTGPYGYVEKEDELEFKTERGESEDYRSAVYIRRWGESVFPVDVRITFTNGETVLEHWDGRDRWTRFEYVKPAKVDKVEVDPEHILVLDFNYSNNSWVRNSEAGFASRKWAVKWMIWLQNLMEFFSFFS